LVLFFVDFPDVTPDKLLTAVFGGLFIGAGIGLAIRGGGVLDGTEIAALLVSRNSHLLRVGDVILILPPPCRRRNTYPECLYFPDRRSGTRARVGPLFDPDVCVCVKNDRFSDPWS
jgi:hypothetical protein